MHLEASCSYSSQYLFMRLFSMPDNKIPVISLVPVFVWIVGIFHLWLMILISFSFSEVSHIIKGLLTLSIDQPLFLQIAGFSTSKRAISWTVAWRFWLDNLLCSSRNFSLLVIWNKNATLRNELQIFLYLWILTRKYSLWHYSTLFALKKQVVALVHNVIF